MKKISFLILSLFLSLSLSAKQSDRLDLFDASMDWELNMPQTVTVFDFMTGEAVCNHLTPSMNLVAIRPVGADDYVVICGDLGNNKGLIIDEVNLRTIFINEIAPALSEEK